MSSLRVVDVPIDAVFGRLRDNEKLAFLPVPEPPAQHLRDFCGTLQADAYAGFNQLYEKRRIQEAACWSHVRRKFCDLQQAHVSPIASEALERIATLYAIEKEIRGRPPDGRNDRSLKFDCAKRPAWSRSVERSTGRSWFGFSELIAGMIHLLVSDH